MLKNFFVGLLLFVVSTLILSSHQNLQSDALTFKMPYKAAGLTSKQAAAHLADRFSFGCTPGQIDKMVKQGLENWFLNQLNGSENEDSVFARIKDYDILSFNNTDIVKIYPRPGKVSKEAVASGFINKDSVKADKPEYRKQLQDFMKQKGYKSLQELMRQTINQKLIRAIYSPNQLHEVLTDFWFNHFNVSATKNECTDFIPVYERDVIRPNVTGNFYDLLLATAKSPAMLTYLDNFSSSGENSKLNNILKIKKGAKKNQGLNENYAREIMELHTLGVDGGYTQKDVTEAARILTGWTIFPLTDDVPGAKLWQNAVNKFGENNLIQQGFVHEGDFLFAMNRHDDSLKTILNKNFAAGGGMLEGVELLKLLAYHVSTAKFISKKLAIRFVSDIPPQSLIDKMSQTFLKSNGKISEVLKTMVASPEFWNTKAAVRQKIKSPFELAVSALRALNADVKMPFLVYQWIVKMGQRYYYYQAPTGFPDKAQYWINAGSLLYRMNFGLALATQKIPGVTFDLTSLNNFHEPESTEAALNIYSKILLPERNVSETINRLKPLINNPEFDQKISQAADLNSNQYKQVIKNNEINTEYNMENESSKKINMNKEIKQTLNKKSNAMENLPSQAGNNSMLAQVVGIILGSPEFQRK